MLALLLTLGLFAQIHSFLNPDLTRSQPQNNNLQQYMAGRLIASEWFRIDGSLSDIYLDNDQGNCSLLFSSRSLQQSDTKPSFRHVVTKLTLLLYDPIYTNKGMIHIDINLKGFFNEEQNQWAGNSTSSVIAYQGGSRINQSTLPVEFVITKTQSNIILNGVSLKISPVTHKKYDWVPCIILILEFSMILYMQFTSIEKISTISSCSVVMVMVNQLSLSFVYIYLSFMILPEYSILLLFGGAFTMACFLRVLQKYHRILEINNKWQKFICIFLMSYIYCHLILFSSQIFNVINSFMLVPQIVKNFRSKSNKISSNNQLILLFCLNNFFPIYLHYSANNAFRISPNQNIGVLILLIAALQIFVLKVQYYTKSCKLFKLGCSAKHVDIQTVVCSICLTEIDDSSVVNTPCDHQFHQKCILKWLRFKKICPMDRSKLTVNDIY